MLGPFLVYKNRKGCQILPLDQGKKKLIISIPLLSPYALSENMSKLESNKQVSEDHY